jgi:GT2 family glycosyltransferase
MKKVTIVVLDYKNKKDTIECIESLNSLLVDNVYLSIIVVNNDTQVQFKETDFTSLFTLKIINNPFNSGYTGGNNVGIKQALSDGAEYILLLNNDTIVDKSLLKQLLEVADSDKKVGLISPKIYFAKGSEFHKDRYKKDDLGNVLWYGGGIMDWQNVLGKHRGVDEVDTGQYDTTEQTDFATGCCMMFRSDVIKRVGLFDEKYFLYYEDSDLNVRVRKKHYAILYAPKAKLWHKNAGSTGGSGSSLQDYYITRNRLLFGVNYAPLRAKIALLKESLRILKSGRTWQKRGVKDYYLQNFGKGSFR